MFPLVKELFSLLSGNQRKRFYSLQFLVILMALMELLGIASIGPFMALIADISLLGTNPIYSQLYQVSGISDPRDFLFLTGAAVLVMLTLASAISMVTTWRLSLFAYEVGVEIADRLYVHYMHQNWLFHAGSSSAQLTKQIATEADRVTQKVIQPLMQLNARAVLAILLSTAILLYNSTVALSGLAIFFSGYWIIYRVVRRRIARYGRHVSETNAQRFRLMNEGFGGIKDVLLLNRSEDFIYRFNQSGKRLARAQGVNTALSQIPRYFVELLAFGAMVGLVLILLKMHKGALNEALPAIAVYALASFKLLPALQQIYQSIIQIKGNTAAFEAIKPDLMASTEAYVLTENAYREQGHIHKNLFQIQHHKTLNLNNIVFTYPGKRAPALDNVNIQIPINSTVGFVGESGSGKSTVIDLLLGLIDPDQGQLQLDDILIDQHNKFAYQANIGFVPQNIFLTEGSIAENIAFGLRRSQIDFGKIQQAARLAHLMPLIRSLPNGIDTKVGERGVQLSGGQRQRIGIARALYNGSQLLIFDEATSALDGVTEKIIMDALQELSGQRTIILIAHRLKTVQQCNIIYLMESGRIVDQGTYKELIERNPAFKRLANSS